MRLAILLFLPVLLLAQSQPPPQGRKADEKPKQQAGPNQKETAIFSRGTKEAPLVIEALESPTKQEEAAKEEARADADLLTNIGILAFTGILTLFTFVQIRWYFLHRKEDAIEYQDEQRAWLDFDVNFPQTVNSTLPIWYQISFFNHGRSVAKKVGFRGNQVIVQKPKEPEDYLALVPVLTKWNSDRAAVFPTTRNELKMRPIPVNSGFIPSSGHVSQMSLGTHELILSVEIEYTDRFNVRHTTRHSFAFGGQGGGAYSILIPGSTEIT